MTYNFKRKCKIFSKYTCHELNFFIFKRDKDFFNEVVKLLIENKLEKTFVDQYLLASSLESNDTEYAKYVLSHIDSSYKINILNMFERCLLVEFCLLKGGDGHKLGAKALAQNVINEQIQKEKREA